METESSAGIDLFQNYQEAIGGENVLAPQVTAPQQQVPPGMAPEALGVGAPQPVATPAAMGVAEARAAQPVPAMQPSQAAPLSGSDAQQPALLPTYFPTAETSMSQIIAPSALSMQYRGFPQFPQTTTEPAAQPQRVSPQAGLYTSAHPQPGFPLGMAAPYPPSAYPSSAAPAQGVEAPTAQPAPEQPVQPTEALPAGILNAPVAAPEPEPETPAAPVQPAPAPVQPAATQPTATPALASNIMQAPQAQAPAVGFMPGYPFAQMGMAQPALPTAVMHQPPVAPATPTAAAASPTASPSATTEVEAQGTAPAQPEMPSTTAATPATTQAPQQPMATPTQAQMMPQMFGQVPLINQAALFAALQQRAAATGAPMFLPQQQLFLQQLVAIQQAAAAAQAQQQHAAAQAQAQAASPTGEEAKPTEGETPATEEGASPTTTAATPTPAAPTTAAATTAAATPTLVQPLAALAALQGVPASAAMAPGLGTMPPSAAAAAAAAVGTVPGAFPAFSAFGPGGFSMGMIPGAGAFPSGVALGLPNTYNIMPAVPMSSPTHIHGSYTPGSSATSDTPKRGRRQKKGNKRDEVCPLCEQLATVGFVECTAGCGRVFHDACLPVDDQPHTQEDRLHWACPDCRDRRHRCPICGIVSPDAELSKCFCGRYYHPACLEQHPLTRRSKSSSLICPLHTCTNCKTTGTSQATVKCIRCPTMYHCKCLPKTGIKRIGRKYMLCERCVDPAELEAEMEAKQQAKTQRVRRPRPAQPRKPKRARAEGVPLSPVAVAPDSIPMAATQAVPPVVPSLPATLQPPAVVPTAPAPPMPQPVAPGAEAAPEGDAAMEPAGADLAEMDDGTPARGRGRGRRGGALGKRRASGDLPTRGRKRGGAVKRARGTGRGRGRGRGVGGEEDAEYEEYWEEEGEVPAQGQGAEPQPQQGEGEGGGGGDEGGGGGGTTPLTLPGLSATVPIPVPANYLQPESLSPAQVAAVAQANFQAAMLAQAQAQAAQAAVKEEVETETATETETETETGPEGSLQGEGVTPSAAPAPLNEQPALEGIPAPGPAAVAHTHTAPAAYQHQHPQPPAAPPEAAATTTTTSTQPQPQPQPQPNYPNGDALPPNDPQMELRLMEREDEFLWRRRIVAHRRACLSRLRAFQEREQMLSNDPALECAIQPMQLDQQAATPAPEAPLAPLLRLAGRCWVRKRRLRVKLEYEPEGALDEEDQPVDALLTSLAPPARRGRRGRRGGRIGRRELLSTESAELAEEYGMGDGHHLTPDLMELIPQAFPRTRATRAMTKHAALQLSGLPGEESDLQPADDIGSPGDTSGDAAMTWSDEDDDDADAYFSLPSGRGRGRSRRGGGRGRGRGRGATRAKEPRRGGRGGRGGRRGGPGVRRAAARVKYESTSDADEDYDLTDSEEERTGPKRAHPDADYIESAYAPQLPVVPAGSPVPVPVPVPLPPVGVLEPGAALPTIAQQPALPPALKPSPPPLPSAVLPPALPAMPMPMPAAPVLPVLGSPTPPAPAAPRAPATGTTSSRVIAASNLGPNVTLEHLSGFFSMRFDVAGMEALPNGGVRIELGDEDQAAEAVKRFNGYAMGGRRMKLEPLVEGDAAGPGDASGAPAASEPAPRSLKHRIMMMMKGDTTTPSPPPE